MNQAFDEIPVRSFSVSIMLLRDKGNRMETLLLRRVGTLEGIWCPVAGKIEAGEQGWETALRECREETGLVPERLYSADYCEQFYEADRNCISIVPTFVGYVAADAKVQLNEEHDAFAWVLFEQARDMLTFDGQKHMFAHVERNFTATEPTEWLRIEF